MGIKEAYNKIIKWKDTIYAAGEKEGWDNCLISSYGAFLECKDILEEECFKDIKKEDEGNN